MFLGNVFDKMLAFDGSGRHTLGTPKLMVQRALQGSLEVLVGAFLAKALLCRRTWLAMAGAWR